MEKMNVNEKELLGKGKGLHHVPCEYYQFGNKIEAEMNDYQRINSIGIRIPKMIDVDIDYFPTNFVVQDGLIYYIDFECNNYMEEWNFENWGIKYWSKTKEFLEYVSSHT